MRRFLKIALAGGITALAPMLIRRLLAQDLLAQDEPPAAQPENPGGGEPSLTRDQLYREATRLEIKGRSMMNKRQLQKAVEDARVGGKP